MNGPDTPVDSASGTSPQPLLNAVEVPAVELEGDPDSGPGAAAGGGGKKVPPPRLTAVGDSDSPEPPGGADLDRERQRLVNDAIRAGNEHRRAETRALVREVDSEARIAEAESETKNKGSETDRQDRRVERYAAMALIFIGAGVSAFLTPVGGIPLIGIGGTRLRALTPNKRSLLPWKRKQSDRPNTS